MDLRHSLPRLAFQAGRLTEGTRMLPEETAVAISYNGTTQAVMMATPADLEDFALGFSLTEGIAAPDEIDSITAVETDRGIDLQIWLVGPAGDRLAARRRSMAGPVGCGLCGIDSLDEALRAVPPVPPSGLALTAAQVMAAIAALPGHQPLHDATRAVHAAAFWRPGQGIIAAREDVGRHNALDKLAGALVCGGAGMVRASTHPTGSDEPARRGGSPAVGCVLARTEPSTVYPKAHDGAIILTSRVSIDMVQKCARIGAAVVIAVSAPTAHAVRMADAAGISLIGLARPDGFEVFTHPSRISTQEAAHVA
ncbi:formate dehydrogenase accessory sulfurtransferase FdhD [Fertoebacter nigrum]|uniref:Sulfur carrier protein FdhD n=2 Tax=Fertoeibacter niger TaxID=2656921 RepID=A0A8X8H0N7_9RHOB|nr:formate dehydrogenase accessory sulfurtransferase FdhD [Fertoeibacter niger]